MSKIFRYELHRLVWSKFFLGLFVITLLYGWQVLTTETILGLSELAPFSPQSFAHYLLRILPLLCASLVFFLWNLCSGRSRAVAPLTAATPVKPGRLLLVKCAAAAFAGLLPACAVTALGVGFLLSVFGAAVPLSALLGTAAMLLLPAPLILMVAGLVFGELHARRANVR